MLFSEDIYKHMYAALQQAEYAFEHNEVPIGAVVVYQNKIIGKGYNQVESLQDATAHAEMIALTAASNHLNGKLLNECDLYVTVEPCIMCCGAVLLNRVRNLYFAGYEPKFGAAGSVYNLLENNKYNHKVNVFSGILADESKTIMQQFFRKQREQRKKDT